jgi:hypothetical protein
MPCSAAASRTTPVALATPIALPAFLPHISDSTATASGRCSAMAAATARYRASTRSASGDPAGVRIVEAVATEGRPPVAPTAARPVEAMPGSTPITSRSNTCSV